MAYWSRLVVGKCARFVKFKNITVCIEANKYLLLLLLRIIFVSIKNIFLQHSSTQRIVVDVSSHENGRDYYVDA